MFSRFYLLSRPAPQAKPPGAASAMRDHTGRIPHLNTWRAFSTRPGREVFDRPKPPAVCPAIAVPLKLSSSMVEEDRHLLTTIFWWHER